MDVDELLAMTLNGLYGETGQSFHANTTPRIPIIGGLVSSADFPLADSSPLEALPLEALILEALILGDRFDWISVPEASRGIAATPINSIPRQYRHVGGLKGSIEYRDFIKPSLPVECVVTATTEEHTVET